MGTTPFLESIPTGMVKNRFYVKASSMDNGVNPIQYMVAIYDILENNFSLKRYDSKDQVTTLIASLHLI